MSGIVLATTTALAFYKLTGVLPYMVYVRKEEEDSHGDPVEYNYQSGEGTMAYLQKDRQFFFIDDFIESGTTLHYCRQAVQRTFGVELTGKNLTLLTSSANTDFDAWDDCIDLGECDEYVWNTGASSTKQPLKLTESTISTE
jgi:adenine/guanine phosphoribosyltransferase-like PRPP-binding protein